MSSDYKPKSFLDGPPVDAAGRITRDPEGRELFATYIARRTSIAGRTSRTGSEQAIPPAEFNAITKGVYGGVPAGFSPGRNSGGVVAAFTIRVPPGADCPAYGIEYSNALSPTLQTQFIKHEIGHMIDEFPSKIRVTDAAMHKELERNYNTLNNPERATVPGSGRHGMQTGEAAKGKFYTPEDLNYRGGEVVREHMAEAIRAYMANPNYFKTVAPKTAAAIRASVNGNPRLNRVVQFNAGGLPLFALPEGRPPLDGGAVTLRSPNLGIANWTLPMRLALTLAALMIVSPAVADSLPHFAEGMPYKAVRTKLMARGYTPSKSPNADKCDAKDDSRCFPEMESCAGTGLGNCNFDWQKNGRKIQVSTVGEPPTFDGIGPARR